MIYGLVVVSPLPLLYNRARLCLCNYCEPTANGWTAPAFQQAILFRKWQSYLCPRKMLHLAILRVSKQTNMEAATLFYSENLIRFELNTGVALLLLTQEPRRSVPHPQTPNLTSTASRTGVGRSFMSIEVFRRFHRVELATWVHESHRHFCRSLPCEQHECIINGVLRALLQRRQDSLHENSSSKQVYLTIVGADEIHNDTVPIYFGPFAPSPLALLARIQKIHKLNIRGETNFHNHEGLLTNEEWLTDEEWFFRVMGPRAFRPPVLGLDQLLQSIKAVEVRYRQSFGA